MDNNINIPAEMYADDVVCFIANRYHVTSQEAVQGFFVQSGIASNAKDNPLAELSWRVSPTSFRCLHICESEAMVSSARCTAIYIV